MFNNKTNFLVIKNEAFYNFGDNDALFDIKISGRFINKINISRSSQTNNKSNALEFTTRKFINIGINKRIDFKRRNNIGFEIRIKEKGFNFGMEKITNSTIIVWINNLGFIRNIKSREKIAG